MGSPLGSVCSILGSTNTTTAAAISHTGSAASRSLETLACSELLRPRQTAPATHTIATTTKPASNQPKPNNGTPSSSCGMKNSVLRTGDSLDIEVSMANAAAQPGAAESLGWWATY